MENLNESIARKRIKGLYLYILFTIILPCILLSVTINIFIGIGFSIFFFFSNKITIEKYEDEIQMLKQTEIFDSNCCKFENNSIYSFIIPEINPDIHIREIFLKSGKYNFQILKQKHLTSHFESFVKIGEMNFDLSKNDKLIIYKKNDNLEYNEDDDDINFSYDDINFNYKIEKINFDEIKR